MNWNKLNLEYDHDVTSLPLTVGKYFFMGLQFGMAFLNNYFVVIT